MRRPRSLKAHGRRLHPGRRFCSKGWILTSVLVCLAAPACGPNRPANGNGPLAAVARECASSAPTATTGVGQASVTTALQSANETVTFDVPCHVHIGAGGSLKLDHDDIQAKTLYISDDTAYAGASVKIESSTIKSSGDFGFAIQLYDARDQIRINASTVVYQEAFLARIDGQGPSGEGGGQIGVYGSSISTPGPGSKGIEMTAGGITGTADFANDSLDTGDFGTPALMYAGTCKYVQVNGKSGSCGAPAGKPAPTETLPPLP